jgi:DNA-binding NarL/FixJ family response regulator
LPPNELQALDLLSQGKRIREIASFLHASQSTIKRWLALAYARLGAANGYEAIRLATEAGVFRGSGNIKSI